MTEEKKNRIQLSKEEKRLQAERSKEIAFAEEERRRKEARDKSARLKALRSAHSSPSA